MSQHFSNALNRDSEHIPCSLPRGGNSKIYSIFSGQRTGFSVPDGHNTQIPVHGETVAGVDQGAGVGYAGDAGQAVFAGDNGAVNQHAAAPLHDGRGQGYHEGHIGIDGIADENFTGFELKEVVDR